ncbi:META domain-containing protein [Streptomyces soliscabiei]|uniref:META domain-containing protein n=1 Tax=Streptomyces soliscabiei TaxID=588897 RepID=UPI0029B82A8F|nr:META domain-containing protein [Streptomyces sp. NY05-11A]MDX2681026.1 META domain-containing protein [Streptomyces sp. NY05-11A]
MYTYGHKQRMMVTAVAVLVPLAAACGSEKADGGQPGSGSVSAEQPVTGVRWNVDSVIVDGATHRAPSGAHVEIEDGKAAGNYGCNNFTAKVVVGVGTIRFTDSRSTRMACTDQPMSFERTLAGTLGQGALTTEVKGATVTLATADGDQVRLTRK